MWKVFQQYERQTITLLDTNISETNMSLTMPPHPWRQRQFIHCFSGYPLPNRVMSIGGTKYNEHNGILQYLLLGDKVVYPKRNSDKGEDRALLSPKHSSADLYWPSCIETAILWNIERHPRLHEPDLHAAANHHVKGFPAMLFSAEGQKKAPDPL